MRLVRKVSVVLVAPLLLLVLTLNRSGPLPAPTLPPSFDPAAAAALTTELASLNPNRVPGSPGAATAVEWYREKLALYGLPVREDRWEEDVPGVGRVELKNLAAVVPGTLDETIVIVAHRDNNGRTAGANDNASGTAALVELARPYATVGHDRVRADAPPHARLPVDGRRRVRRAGRGALRGPFATCPTRRRGDLARRPRGHRPAAPRARGARRPLAAAGARRDRDAADRQRDGHAPRAALPG